jgi:tetratricopeptide (TPR) repeat protein
VHGLKWFDAVVETDNLRHGFTFNIRVTQPHIDILIKKGTPIGCFFPYPRFFLDRFKLTELEDPVELANAQTTIKYSGFARELEIEARTRPGLQYMEGRDIYGYPFAEHQKSLDSGAWWHSQNHNDPACVASDDEKRYEEALKTIEHVGQKGERAAALMNELAYLYIQRRKYTQAEPLLKRALGIYEEIKAKAQEDSEGRRSAGDALKWSVKNLEYIYKMMDKIELLQQLQEQYPGDNK